MLADSWIRSAMGRDLVINPPPEDVQIQPASLDLRLGAEFKYFLRPTSDEPIDPAVGVPEQWMEKVVVGPSGHYLIQPDAFTLGTTVEWVEMPNGVAARVEGKSSLGRLGLLVHATAGFIDPGFKGTITLEMTNLGPRPILLRVGMRICQLSFDRVEGQVLRPYGHPDLKSKYQGQRGVTESRLKDGGR